MQLATVRFRWPCRRSISCIRQRVSIMRRPFWKRSFPYVLHWPDLPDSSVTASSWCTFLSFKFCFPNPVIFNNFHFHESQRYIHLCLCCSVSQAFLRCKSIRKMLFYVTFTVNFGLPHLASGPSPLHFRKGNGRRSDAGCLPLCLASGRLELQGWFFLADFIPAGKNFLGSILKVVGF